MNMARRKKKVDTKGQDIAELKELLFAGPGNIESEGLLTFAGRVAVGDNQQTKIARVKEIVESL